MKTPEPPLRQSPRRSSPQQSRQGLSRRHALCCSAALGAGLFSSLLAGSGDAQAAALHLRNPCLPPAGAAGDGLPDSAELRDLVHAAFSGVTASRLIDSHAHLLGIGDSGSGCTVHPSMNTWWRPLEVLRKHMILNAACVAGGAGAAEPEDKRTTNGPAPQPTDAMARTIDGRYVQRLQHLSAGFPSGARWWLYAFAKAHDDQGRPRDDWSTFHVPNAYAAQVAQANPGRFDWVASIHPYAVDALQQLDLAQQQGAVAVKWLPSAMNIDPASNRCKAFYDALQKNGLPLIVHCGEEKAAPGARRDAYVNPLLMRHPLAQGVRVIVAHAASLGEAHDTDRPSQPQVPAFDLFARLMDEQQRNRSPGLLLADISAVFQRNRSPDVWRRILQREDWHAQLLHGSDYPLPGVLPLFAPRQLVNAGLLDAAVVPPLLKLREHNALLFDFVLKRQLRLGSLRLPASVFEAQALASPLAANKS
jgi:uncharacterized protein